MAVIAKSELGTTGVWVSKLGYGAMELRGAPRSRAINPNDAGRLLNEALDLGINLIDTAPDYGDSELLIGRYIGNRRSEYFLATKCGCNPEAQPGADGRMPHSYQSHNLREVIDRSLRNLRTDYIDLIQFHGNPTREQLEQESAMQTLEGLQREGKLRFLGISSVSPNIEHHLDENRFDCYQIPYGATRADHEVYFGRLSALRAGVLARGTIARADSMNWGRSFPESSEPAEPYRRRWHDASLDDLLEEGMSRVEFMLRFVLSAPLVTAALLGTVNLAHLRENAKFAAKGPLNPQLVAEARRRLGLLDLGLG